MIDGMGVLMGTHIGTHMGIHMERLMESLMGELHSGCFGRGAAGPRRTNAPFPVIAEELTIGIYGRIRE